MSDKTHPLEPFVLDAMRNGNIMDVTLLANALSGATIFKGRNAKKGMNAYRIVAADVLGYMACAGRLEQHGAWGKNPEDGGPYFSLPASR